MSKYEQRKKELLSKRNGKKPSFEEYKSSKDKANPPRFNALERASEYKNYIGKMKRSYKKEHG
jgi:hypothetical protein